MFSYCRASLVCIDWRKISACFLSWKIALWKCETCTNAVREEILCRGISLAEDSWLLAFTAWKIPHFLESYIQLSCDEPMVKNNIASACGSFYILETLGVGFTLWILLSLFYRLSFSLWAQWAKSQTTFAALKKISGWNSKAQRDYSKDLESKC